MRIEGTMESDDDFMVGTRFRVSLPLCTIDCGQAGDPPVHIALLAS